MLDDKYCRHERQQPEHGIPAYFFQEKIHGVPFMTSQHGLEKGQEKCSVAVRKPKIPHDP
jgi:hypothetical protein